MRWMCVVVVMLTSASAASVTQTAMTIKEMDAALAAKPQGDEAIALADRIRTAFGGRDTLLRGAPPKIDDLTVGWAIELAEPLAWKSALKLRGLIHSQVNGLALKRLAFFAFADQIELGGNACVFQMSGDLHAYVRAFSGFEPSHKQQLHRFAKPLAAGSVSTLLQFCLGQTRIQEGTNVGRLIRPPSVHRYQTTM